MAERLQKFMARCGVASRRDCELIIKGGRVAVNGEIVVELGTKINPQRDIVFLDGQSIQPEQTYVYIMLNKPKGYITSLKDSRGRPTIMDLIGETDIRIYPVGRLDYDSEGLLLITNDGTLTHYLTHPKYEVKKQYRALVSGMPTEKKINELRRGIIIDDRITYPAHIEELDVSNNNKSYRVIIHEGRNRQVRKMFDSIGHPVLELRREKIASVELGSLKLGSWRYLTQNEIGDLKRGMNNAKI